MRQNFESTVREHLSIVDLLATVLLDVSVPERNSYRVTGELSRRDELLNAFPDRSRWLELLQKNILQSGQHF
jgi:hypothetical protein